MYYKRHRERKDNWLMPEVLNQWSIDGIHWYNEAKWPIVPIALRQEICDDELHGPPPYKGNKDKGGPLDLWKFELGSPIGGRSDAYYRAAPPDYQWRGRRWIQPIATEPSYFPSWRDSNWGDASSYGATGWDKFKPAKPGVDLGVSLAEMRETWRSLLSRARSFKDIYSGRRTLPTNPAGNMLDWNFGWAPLISDIQKAITTYQSLDDMIDRIRKMNGRWEHRGGTVKSEQESWSEKKLGTRIHPTYNTYFYGGLVLPANLTYTLDYEYTSKVWFEGAFKYYIPDINTPEWASKARRKLMGLNLNPALVWELIPWSWLVDWLSNAGDVFSNLDDGLAENLTAAYAYVMRTTTYTINLVDKLVYNSPGSPSRTQHTVTMSLLHKWQRKHRVAASPFGFGVDFGSFSPKQIAIMAALGLSRT